MSSPAFSSLKYSSDYVTHKVHGGRYTYAEKDGLIYLRRVKDGYCGFPMNKEKFIENYKSVK